VKTQKQLEGHDNMDLVILPPNTSSIIHRTVHTLIETRIHREDFRKKVQDILSIPGGDNDDAVKRQKKKTNEAKQHVESGNDNMARMVCLTSRVKKMTKEIGDMMKMICMFCNCHNVEKKIDEYYKNNSTASKRLKRFKTSLSILQNSYAIPLQLLDLTENTEECKITISKEVSTIFFSSILYQESLISPENILDVFLQTVDIKEPKIPVMEPHVDKPPVMNKDTMAMG